MTIRTRRRNPYGNENGRSIPGSALVSDGWASHTESGLVPQLRVSPRPHQPDGVLDPPTCTRSNWVAGRSSSVRRLRASFRMSDEAARVPFKAESARPAGRASRLPVDSSPCPLPKSGRTSPVGGGAPVPCQLERSRSSSPISKGPPNCCNSLCPLSFRTVISTIAPSAQRSSKAGNRACH